MTPVDFRGIKITGWEDHAPVSLTAGKVVRVRLCIMVTDLIDTVVHFNIMQTTRGVEWSQ